MAYAFGRNLLLNSVGFERLIDAFEKIDAPENAGRAQAYPPYNIVKLSDHHYTAEGNKLSIVGKVKNDNPGQFLHKGIATRDFTHQFTLAETVVVRDADMVNGMLVIKLENVIPEEKLPRKIMIGGAAKLVVNERQAA